MTMATSESPVAMVPVKAVLRTLTAFSQEKLPLLRAAYFGDPNSETWKRFELF
ncbi:MAG: hypothetical protein ABR861_04130 [Terriglobales bacterium]